MKVLSVKQPWAKLIASGSKSIEARTWTTLYRGPLPIVSSKRPNKPPPGKAVAIAELVDCRQITEADEEAACCKIYPDAKAWVSENVQRVRPLPAKGHWEYSTARLKERCSK